ncbi:MAG: sensor histidine kinase [Phenylobacterium sp.]|uniref:sensor histidine kinase n=1 Tax=Phenylobacterium sp. TaxID=1871053 RepID=UPI00391C7AEB
MTEILSAGRLDLSFLSGGGRVGEMMRGHEWKGSPLGQPASWPQSLRSVVGLLLNSKFPMFVAWGEDLGFLYNDAYAEILGAKHPAALGGRFRQVWAEIWEEISPLVSTAMRGEASYHENLRLTVSRKGYDEEAWFTFSYSPVRAEDGIVAGMFCAVHETTELVLAERRLSGERQRLVDMFEQAPTFMAMLSGPEHRIEMANPGYMALVGHRPVVGRTVADALPDAVAQGYLTLLDGVYSSGVAYAANGAKYAVQAEPQGPVDERYVDFVYQPLKDGEGKVTGVFVLGADVTDRTLSELAVRSSQEQLKLMVLELNHRVKNNLATVQSIAVQTLRGSDPPERMREALVQRISALAAAHDILTREQWEGATLSNIALGVLEPLAVGDRIRLSGSEVRLSSKVSLALSMAFHELGTNAVKYGALSTGSGSVELTWQVAGGDQLRLEWRERGGPPVHAPARRGFGSRLLERGLAGELNGEVEMTFPAEGRALPDHGVVG